jgi:hypothetical protein
MAIVRTERIHRDDWATLFDLGWRTVRIAEIDCGHGRFEMTLHNAENSVEKFAMRFWEPVTDDDICYTLEMIERECRYGETAAWTF